MPTRWYTFNRPVSIFVGNDSERWRFQTQARTYSINGCGGLVLLRLDRAVPATIATPARVITRPSRIPGSGARLKVAGWGSSGLDDLTMLETPTANTTNTRPISRFDWDVIGHAHQITGMAQTGGFLYAASERNGLWRRVANGANTAWRRVGAAPGVVAMAASGGSLYAATSDNRLISRPANAQDVAWRYVGSAYRFVGMTALNGQLYAATAFNTLMTRAAIDQTANWSLIGPANDIVALAASRGKIFGNTSDGQLISRDPGQANGPWTTIGTRLPGLRSLAATRTHLFFSLRTHPQSTPKNSRRFRQVAQASFSSAQPCTRNNWLVGVYDQPDDPQTMFCINPAGHARLRRADQGAPVYWTSSDGTRFLIGVAAKEYSSNENNRFIRTAFVSTNDGRVGHNDFGPWLEVMAGVGRGR